MDSPSEDGTDGRPTKPNSAFLHRMLQGVTTGNQRVLDQTASKAARKAVGASAAASLRPVLARSLKKGPAAIRRVALTAAQQQKLTLCSSLLTEVALSFGFRLQVLGPDGQLLRVGSWEAALQHSMNVLQPVQGTTNVNTAANDAQQQAQQGGDASEVAAAAAAEAGEQQHQTATAQQQPQQANGSHHSTTQPAWPLQDLRVMLHAAGRRPRSGSGIAKRPSGIGAFLPTDVQFAAMEQDGDQGFDQGIEEEEVYDVPGGSLSPKAKLKVARPRLALGTLEGLSKVLGRGRGMGSGGDLLAAARKRALTRRVSQQGNGSESAGKTQAQVQSGELAAPTKEVATSQPDSTLITGKATVESLQEPSKQPVKQTKAAVPAATGEQITEVTTKQTGSRTAAAAAHITTLQQQTPEQQRGTMPKPRARIGTTDKIGVDAPPKQRSSPSSDTQEGLQSHKVATSGAALQGSHPAEGTDTKDSFAVDISQTTSHHMPQQTQQQQQQQQHTPAAGSKRAAGPAGNSLFGAAMRDIKRVRKAPSD